MIRKKLYKLSGVLCAVILMLCGCSQNGGAADTQKDTLAEAPKASASETSNKNQEQSTGTTGIELLDIEDMFSDRDKEIGFDEASDIVIALEGNGASCNSDAVIIEGSKVTITEEGTYILTGSLENGQIVVEAEDSDKVQLVLKGVDITCETSAPIYVKQADKVFMTLAANTENSLAVTKEFIAIDDNNIDSAIFSKDDLTLNGSGSLKITSTQGHGIVSKDDLVITGGSIEIQAAGHGLSGKDSVRIADGNFSITVDDDGIHAENDDDMTLGFVYIAGGEYNMNVGDDGIHAGAQAVIDGGNIFIPKCLEGIEGQTVDIRGGNIALVAEDDGINAASSETEDEEATSGNANRADNPFEIDEGSYIHISGGTIDVTAYGDGIDSNGGLEISGGVTYVSGPENNGNGSLDYAGEGKITGGVLVAACYSGMTQNMGNTSMQGAIMITLAENQQAGSEIKLQDAEGKVLVTFAPKTSYNCVLVSCPEITQGSTYSLAAGTEVQEIEMTSLIYGAGGMNGGMGGGMQGGRPGGMGGGKGGMRPDGQMGDQQPNGEIPEGMPEMPNGEMPEGMPEMQNGEMPEGMPEMPNGEMPEGMPEMPQGGMPGGQKPQGTTYSGI